jgi:hypothetical protein
MYVEKPHAYKTQLRPVHNSIIQVSSSSNIQIQIILTNLKSSNINLTLNMKFNVAVLLAAAMTVYAAPFPQAPTLAPTTGADSLSTMLHGAMAFSPNFLTGNLVGVATNIGEMVVGAASYPFTWYIPGSKAGAPKRTVEDEKESHPMDEPPVKDT